MTNRYGFKSKYIKIFPHTSLVTRVLFFWVKTIFASMPLFKMKKDFLIYSSENELNFDPRRIRNDFYLESFEFEIYNETICLGKLNLFQYYISLSGLFSDSIYEEYVSILFLLHNSINALLIPIVVSNRIEKYGFEELKSFSLSFCYICSAISFLEFLISVYNIYRNRKMINFSVFKKIGANERIKHAFATRMRLKAAIKISLFLAIVICMKIIVPPLPPTNSNYLGIIFFSFLTCIFCLVVCVNFNDENKVQRKIAIIIYFIKLAVITLVKFDFFIYRREYLVVSDAITIFAMANFLIVSFVVFYTVISDFAQFGSGLKEYLNENMKKVDLSK